MSKVYPAVKAVIDKGGKFLVLKDRETGNWTLPGGRVEFGETPEQALKREVKEETGMRIVVGKPVGVWWFFRNDGDQVVLTNFHCKAVGKLKLTRECSDCRWVALREFISKRYATAHPSLKRTLRDSLG
jgi:8-oxo-dGTP diphosphatase